MKRSTFVGFFARHRNAGNLLMVLAIAIGWVALGRLNTQFFPNFQIDEIYISVNWSGASADDVDRSIAGVIEPQAC